MSLWWWPGLIFTGAALVATFPRYGCWVGVALAISAVVAEYAASGWHRAALVLPIALLTVSALALALLSYLTFQFS